MLVDPDDGKCYECEGQLNIIGVDDCSMAVECTDCGESYDVEPDAFGDGCVTYYYPITTEQYLAENFGDE
jgi:hypothetical protein